MPTTGNVILEATGNNILSTFTPILAVYTGSSVSALTLVTNAPGSVTEHTSIAVFTAAGSTTYRVAVDGTNVNGITGMGDFVLQYIRPTLPVFTIQPQSQTCYTN